MLTIKNLHVSVENKEILRGINLQVNTGEVHAIMGPNGLAKVRSPMYWQAEKIYQVTQGAVYFMKVNLY